MTSYTVHFFVARSKVGIAVALEKGLIVPVINNADNLDLLQTARVVNELSAIQVSEFFYAVIYLSELAS